MRTSPVEAAVILLNVMVKVEEDVNLLDVNLVIIFLLHHQLVQREDVVVPVLSNVR